MGATKMNLMLLPLNFQPNGPRTLTQDARVQAVPTCLCFSSAEAHVGPSSLCKIGLD